MDYHKRNSKANKEHCFHRKTKQPLYVKGKANIVLTEFQIERPSLLGLAVEDLVEVNYEFIYKH